ncbi:hypothetical protein GOP47_0026572 [Adiantum capillus-veneris]|nr:hypothetical protein GOP47_0026572 [Adiantum capillus-veneris]
MVRMQSRARQTLCNLPLLLIQKPRATGTTRASDTRDCNHQSAKVHVHSDVPRRRRGRHACSFATSAARNVCAYRRVPTATNKFAHATTTGRRNKGDPSAREMIVGSENNTIGISRETPSLQ